MSDIEKIIELASENALLKKVLNDIVIVLLSKSDRKPIISGYDIENLNLIFTEIYKLKGWSIPDHENSNA